VPVLEALGTAVPGAPIPQAALRAKAEEVLAVLAPELLDKLSVFETVGIDTRHFVRPIEWYLEPHGWGERNAVYADVGTKLLEEATRRALADARLPPEAIDGVVLVSTTGISTPSLDARLANRIGLRPDVARVPVFGLGCAGGVGGLRIASDLARANPEERYLLLSLELCSLAFNLTDMSVRAFVATTLFADGCAAALVRGDACEGRTLARVGAGAAHQWRDTEDVMGWDVLDEGLRVVFSRRIPEITRHQLRPVVERLAKSSGATPTRYVFHPGGTKVLEAYEEGLGLDPRALDSARRVLRAFGNMSSPSVLFVLQEALRERAMRADDVALLAALGPGFSAELMLLHG
jgi:alkylresorcinol/alkylpyrone synthase